MNKTVLSLSLIMGSVVLASNYLVQFPIHQYGLSEILTYGAFTYPIAFLITDLANRSFGKEIAKLVDGVTKLNRLDISDPNLIQVSKIYVGKANPEIFRAYLK